MNKSFFFLFIPVLLSSCSSRFDMVRLEPTNNVLRYTITASLKKTERLKLKIFSEDTTEHVVEAKDRPYVLTNLVPSKLYQYQFDVSEGDAIIYSSALLSFKTDSLPGDFLMDIRLIKDSISVPGYFLFRRFFKKEIDFIFDFKLQPRWYQTGDSVALRAFQWDADQKYIVELSDSSTIVEFDIKGNKLGEYRLEDVGLNRMVHHDILKDSVGNLYVINYVKRVFDLSSLGGGKADTVKADGISIISPQKEIIWQWSVFDVMDPLTDGDIMMRKSDWVHANSLCLDKDGNILISLRDFSQVWKIDLKTGKTLWKLGNGGDIDIPEVSHFIRQHDVHFTTEGELLLFDNGLKGVRDQSRIVGFQIDEQSMRAELTTLIDLPLELTTYRMGSVRKLPDDLFLVNTARQFSILSIINREADIVWQGLISPSSFKVYYLSDF